MLPSQLHLDIQSVVSLDVFQLKFFIRFWFRTQNTVVINVYISLPFDLNAYGFCTGWSPDMYGCMQHGVFGRAMDRTMNMTKLWRTSSASYSINTHLHLKLKFSTKFIVAQDNPYKSETVSEIGACNQFAIPQVISSVVFDKRCRVFWTVICSATCLLCFISFMTGLSHSVQCTDKWWVRVCRRGLYCTNVCVISGMSSYRVVHLISGTADRWQWHLCQQSSKRPIDAGRSASRIPLDKAPIFSGSPASSGAAISRHICSVSTFCNLWVQGKGSG